MKTKMLFFVCLFLVPLAFAQSAPPEDGGLRSDVRGIPQSIVASERAQSQQDNAEFVNPQLQLIRSILTSNIDPNDFEGLWKLVVSVLSLFYLLLFAVAGGRMVIGSFDAGQREQAKEELKHAFIVLVLVNASLLLYSLALNVSSSVSAYLYDSVFQEKDEYFASLNQFPAFNPIAWLLIGVSLLGVIVTLAVRDLILILGVMLLPIGIFLYFFRPLKGWGSLVLNTLLAAIFLQVVDVIVLAGVSLMLSRFELLAVIGLDLVLALLFLFLANVVVFVFAVRKAAASHTVTVVRNTVTEVRAFAGQASANLAGVE